jgi:hypothetical protein
MGSRKLVRGLASTLRCFVAAALALAVSLSIAAPAFAAGGQFGNLSGTVVNASTKAPIAGAHIVATAGSGTYNATTDAKGFFIILQMNVDTYTVSVSAPNFESQNITGVPVFGGETDPVGAVALNPSLKTIAETHSRSVSSAFQPTQTIDAYTVNKQQMLEATGNTQSADENALFLSVPGVTLTNAGTVTIRGGATTEVGYQYDGIPFKEPFLGGNGSNGLANGLGSIQVVEGAGDATQGGVGSGVLNVIPQRGSGPGSGVVDFESGGPNFSHQFSADYGFGSANGRWSEYIAFSAQSFVPYTGYRLDNLSQYLDAFASNRQQDTQFTNNLIYRFGKNNHESLQMLYTNIAQEVFTPNVPGNTFALYPGSIFNGIGSGLLGVTPAQFAQLVRTNNFVPNSNVPPTGNNDTSNLHTRLLKFEYDNSLNSTTYLSLKYYNWEQLSTSSNEYLQGAPGQGLPQPDFESTGGQNVGGIADLTHQFGSNLTVTLDGAYESSLPAFDEQNSGITAAYASPIIGFGFANDFLPGGYLCPNGATGGQSVLCGGTLKLPTWGIGYQKTQFQNWGYGIRFQYAASDKLHFDVGVREEGQNQHWNNELGQLGIPSLPGSNPFDIVSSAWNPNVLFPQVTEPRGSVSYQIDRNDAVRFSYGRSAVFSNSQTAGTPFNLTGLQQFNGILANPNGPACNPHPGNVGKPGYVAAAPGTPGCTLYAQQLYWAGDAEEYPDAGNTLPSIYGNYDFSYSHQFANGWGAKLTGFRKIGSSIPASIDLNPILGIFEVNNQGLNRTTGGEFSLTTPQSRFGLSGFLSATYQNVLSTTPPLVVGETSVPQLTEATLALGNLYRAGYVSPFVVSIGAQQNFHDGLQIIPQLSYNVGYPYTVGNLIAEQIIGYGGAISNANITQANVTTWTGTSDTSPLLGTGNLGGAAGATNYVDPANPGTITHPNIAATRGTPATASNGGFLSARNTEANMTVQYKKGPNTFGVQFFNLFGNAFLNSVPSPNTFYQPVATGLSGPQTGFNPCQLQVAVGAKTNCATQLPNTSYAFKNGAYVLSNGDFSAGPSIAPLIPFSFQVFYQRAI